MTPRGRTGWRMLWDRLLWKDMGYWVTPGGTRRHVWAWRWDVWMCWIDCVEWTPEDGSRRAGKAANAKEVGA